MKILTLDQAFAAERDSGGYFAIAIEIRGGKRRAIVTFRDFTGDATGRWLAPARDREGGWAWLEAEREAARVHLGTEAA